MTLPYDITKIRNFSIIAHIDHGKSTLADRLLEHTQTLSKREMTDRILDDMELEKERGITIKAKSARFLYKSRSGETYVMNLIDTPGHVDFNYEVSRSLKACEGAVLVVDATQGVQAQTLANAFLAVENDLTLVPVINKIDLPSAEIESTAEGIENILGLDTEGCPRISAKSGLNVPDVLEAIVKDIPPPAGDVSSPLKALVFDAFYDSYKGVIVYVRLFDGKLSAADKIRFMSTGEEFDVVEAGVITPKGLVPAPLIGQDGISAGEVGYFTASIKDIAQTMVGDTVTGAALPTQKPLPGFRKALPMVFAGIYPADKSKYPETRDALERLRLNDASLSFEPETSVALGFGFRCGFLGLLHMEIIEERLEREFDLDLITTLPSVVYEVTLKNGKTLKVDNPADYPDPAEVEDGSEPFVRASIMTPTEHMGAIMELCKERRGEYLGISFLDPKRAELKYDLPLGEIIYDFFDTLKSRSRGYASLDYEPIGYRKTDLVKIDILLNGEKADALSFVTFAQNAYARSRRICEKLKDAIPRQLFEVPIQAAIGGKIIARETVRALRKDVLAKCYGGDITRKKKLLEKQKEGKKKMRSLGSVELPPEAFAAVLKLD